MCHGIREWSSFIPHEGEHEVVPRYAVLRPRTRDCRNGYRSTKRTARDHVVVWPKEPANGCQQLGDVAGTDAMTIERQALLSLEGSVRSGAIEQMQRGRTLPCSSPSKLDKSSGWTSQTNTISAVQEDASWSTKLIEDVCVHLGNLSNSRHLKCHKKDRETPFAPRWSGTASSLFMARHSTEFPVRGEKQTVDNAMEATTSQKTRRYCTQAMKWRSQG